jgi:2-amino-4-hydroxy-6-hydroxymethyldihydropteridine diphosphokinase
VKDVYLGIGSNVDAQNHIRFGVVALREKFGDVCLSPVYETAAVGFEGENFLNLAAHVRTDIHPLALKEFLNALEKRYGRKRNVPKFSDRTLDIDILLYGNLYLNSPKLELPRAELKKYSHVLKPLADLAPDLIHPVCHRSIRDIWDEFEGSKASLERIELDLTC